MATNLNVALIVSAQDRASAELNKITASAGKMEGGFSSARTAVAGFATSAVAGFASIGTAIALVSGAVRTLSELDAGLIGVGKTTGLAGEGLRQLGQDILDINRTTPATASGLLEIAQTAGQLGVQGSENIRKFTETIAKLAVASDLQGEEGATALARLLNVTGENVSNIDRIGSAIVGLGNASAATEAQIARFAGEVARNTQGFGITATEAVGLGAAFAELGLRAEETSSVFGRLMRALGDAARDGGTNLEMIATVAGMTEEAFSSLMKSDSLDATTRFLRGLKPLGTDASAALELIGLSGDEINSVLPTLAQNIDGVSQRLAESQVHYRENIALTKEADAAALGLGAQWQRLKTEGVAALNALAGTGTAAFVTLRGAVSGAADVVAGLTENLKTSAGQIGTFFGFIAGGAGGALMGGNLGSAMASDADEANKALNDLFNSATNLHPAIEAVSESGGDLIGQLRGMAEESKSASRAASEHEKAAKRQAEEIQRAADSIRDANERFRVAGLEASGSGVLALMAERETEALEILRRAGASEAEILETRRRIREEHGEKFLAILERQSAELDAIRAARPGVDIGSVERGMDDVFPSVDVKSVLGADMTPVIPGTFADGLREGIADVKEFNSAVNSGRRAAAAMAQTLGGGFSDALMTIAQGSGKAGDAFKEFGKKVIQTLVEIAIQQAIVAALGMIFAPFTGGFSMVAAGAVGGAVGGAARGGGGGGGMSGSGIPMASSMAGLAPSSREPSVVNNYQISAIDTQSFAMAAAKSERETGVFSGLSRRASLQPGRG